MIKVTLEGIPSYIQSSLSRFVKSPIELEEQLDLSLDSGIVKYLLWQGEYIYGSSRVQGLNPQLAQCAIDVDNSGGEKVRFDFVGIDSRALVKKTVNASLYSHHIALTEASKLLQGVLIDGLGVTQPEELDTRKTLLDVVNRLLNTNPFDYSRTTNKQFALTDDTNVVAALTAVKSPEFKWNTQTTIWECLSQVGAVIDAMPRLVADATGNYTVVTFEFVNAFGNEVLSVDDAVTNAIGENVDESQYNTALSAIVENLRESE